MHLNYYRYGDSAAEPIVFLHGFMGDGLSLLPVIKRLSGKFFCISFDLPGHGKSLFKNFNKSAAPADFISVADLILKSLDGLNIKKCSLYGYSMGGRIAQAICVRSPTIINHLILESASFGIQDSTEKSIRYEKDKALLSGIENKNQFRHFLQKWHNLPLFNSLKGTDLLQNLIKNKETNSVRQLQKAMGLMSVGNQPYFPDEVNATGVPVHYLYGDCDEKYKALSAKMIIKFPGFNFIKIKNASHNINIQFPAIIADHIIRIL